MNKENKQLVSWIGIIALLAILGAIIYSQTKSGPQGGKYDAFATCLSEKGAIFYGAWWCPHCQNQKKAFGDSFDKVKYVECSTPDGRNQLKACADAKITGYPTWVFADGSTMEGEVKFNKLSEKTGCPLPPENTQ